MSLSEFFRDLNISEKCGFVLENPVTNLSSEFSEWTDFCDMFIRGTNRPVVDDTISNIGEFPVGQLKTHEQLRFAKLLLEMIVSGFLYMEVNLYESEKSDKVPAVLPYTIAKPLMEVSNKLGMRPVVTHASMALANVIRMNKKGEFVAENLEIIMPRTFLKGTNAEAYNWFFFVTAEIEAAYAQSIYLIGSALFHGSTEEGKRAMDGAFLAIIESCEKTKLLMRKYRANLPPATFYNEIRSCLWGYDQNPKGLTFEGFPLLGAMKYRGASASETSSLQVIDAFLDVQHTVGQRQFIVANRDFMPRGHKMFIEYVEESVRGENCRLANRIRSHDQYPNAMKALRDLRSEHINLITLYVVMQMDKAGAQGAISPGKMLVGFLKTFRDVCTVEKNE